MIQEKKNTQKQMSLKELQQLKQTGWKQNKLLIPDQELDQIIQAVLADSDPVKYLQNSQSLTHCITQMDCCGYTMIYYLGVESKFDSLLKIFTLSNLPLNSNICFFLLKSIIQIKSEGTYPIISKFLKDLRILENFNKQIEVFKNDQTIFNSLFLRSHFNLQQLWDLKLYKSIVKLFDLNHSIYMQQWVDHYAKQGKIPKNLKIKSSYMNKYNLFHRFLDLKKWEAFIQIFSEQQFEKDHFGSIPFTKFLRHSPQEFIQKYFNQFTNQLSQTLQKEQSEKKKNYFLHDLLQNQSLEDDFLVEFINQNGEDQRRIIYRNQYPIGTYLSVRREFQNQKIVKYLTIQTEDNTYFIQLVGAIQGYATNNKFVKYSEMQVQKTNSYWKMLQEWRKNLFSNDPEIFEIVQDHYYNNVQIGKITNSQINYSMPLAYIPFELGYQSISFINLLVKKNRNKEARVHLKDFLGKQNLLTPMQEKYINSQVAQLKLDSIDILDKQVKMLQLLSLLEEENLSISLRSFVIEQTQEIIKKENYPLTYQLLECYNIYQEQKKIKNLRNCKLIGYQNLRDIRFKEQQSKFYCDINQYQLLLELWPHFDLDGLQNIKQPLTDFLKQNLDYVVNHLLQVSIDDNNSIWLLNLVFNDLLEYINNENRLFNIKLKYLNKQISEKQKYLINQKEFEHILLQDYNLIHKKTNIIQYLTFFRQYNFQMLIKVLPQFTFTKREYQQIYQHLIIGKKYNEIYFILRLLGQNQIQLNKSQINYETQQMSNFIFAAKLHWSIGLSSKELLEFIDFNEIQLGIPFTEEEKLQAITNICLNFQSSKLTVIKKWISSLNKIQIYHLFYSVLYQRLYQFQKNIVIKPTKLCDRFPKPQYQSGKLINTLSTALLSQYEPYACYDIPNYDDNCFIALFQAQNIEHQNFDKTIEFFESLIDLDQMRNQKELYLLYLYLKPQSVNYDILTHLNTENESLFDIIYLTVQKISDTKLQLEYKYFVKYNVNYLEQYLKQNQENSDNQFLFKTFNRKYNQITNGETLSYKCKKNKTLPKTIFGSYEKIYNLVNQLKLNNYQTYIEELFMFIKKQQSPLHFIKEYDLIQFFITHSTDSWVIELLKLTTLTDITPLQLEYQGEPMLQFIIFKKMYKTYCLLQNLIEYQWKIKTKYLQFNTIIYYNDKILNKHFPYDQINMVQMALLNGFIVNLEEDQLLKYLFRTKQFLFKPDLYYQNSTAYKIYQELQQLVPNLNNSILEILSFHLSKYPYIKKRDQKFKEDYQEILLKSILEQKNYSPGSQQNDIMSQSAFSIQQILHSCKCKNNIVNVICELYNIVPTKSYPILHQIFSQFQVDLNTETLYSLCNHYEGIYHPFNKLLINKNLELFFNLETLGSLEYTCKIGLAMNQLEFEKNFMDLEIPNYSLYQINYQILLIIMMIRFDLNFEIKKQNIQLVSCVKALNIIKQSQVNKVKYHHNNHFKKLESLLLEGDSKDYIIQFLIAQFSTLSPLEGYFEMIIYILKLDLQREDICNLVLAQSNFLLKYQPDQVQFDDQVSITKLQIKCQINQNYEYLRSIIGKYMEQNDKLFQEFIKGYLKKISDIYYYYVPKEIKLEFKSLSRQFYLDYIYQSNLLRSYWRFSTFDYYRYLNKKQINDKTQIMQKQNLISEKNVKIIFDEQSKFTLDTVLNFLDEYDPNNKTVLNEITMNTKDIMCPCMFLINLVSIFNQFHNDITPKSNKYQWYMDAKSLFQTFNSLFTDCQTQNEVYEMTIKLLNNYQFNAIFANIIEFLEKIQLFGDEYFFYFIFEKSDKKYDSYIDLINQIDKQSFDAQFQEKYAFGETYCIIEENQMNCKDYSNESKLKCEIHIQIGQFSKKNIDMQVYVENTINTQRLLQKVDIPTLLYYQVQRQINKLEKNLLTEINLDKDNLLLCLQQKNLEQLLQVSKLLQNYIPNGLINHIITHQNIYQFQLFSTRTYQNMEIQFLGQMQQERQINKYDLQNVFGFLIDFDFCRQIAKKSDVFLFIVQDNNQKLNLIQRKIKYIDENKLLFYSRWSRAYKKEFVKAIILLKQDWKQCDKLIENSINIYYFNYFLQVFLLKNKQEQQQIRINQFSLKIIDQLLINENNLQNIYMINDKQELINPLYQSKLTQHQFKSIQYKSRQMKQNLLNLNQHYNSIQHYFKQVKIEFESQIYYSKIDQNQFKFHLTSIINNTQKLILQSFSIVMLNKYIQLSNSFEYLTGYILNQIILQDLQQKILIIRFCSSCEDTILQQEDNSIIIKVEFNQDISHKIKDLSLSILQFLNYQSLASMLLNIINKYILPLLNPSITNIQLGHLNNQSYLIQQKQIIINEKLIDFSLKQFILDSYGYNIQYQPQFIGNSIEEGNFSIKYILDNADRKSCQLLCISKSGQTILQCVNEKQLQFNIVTKDKGKYLLYLIYNGQVCSLDVVNVAEKELQQFVKQQFIKGYYLAQNHRIHLILEQSNPAISKVQNLFKFQSQCIDTNELTIDQNKAFKYRALFIDEKSILITLQCEKEVRFSSNCNQIKLNKVSLLAEGKCQFVSEIDYDHLIYKGIQKQKFIQKCNIHNETKQNQVLLNFVESAKPFKYHYRNINLNDPSLTGIALRNLDNEIQFMQFSSRAGESREDHFVIRDANYNDLKLTKIESARFQNIQNEDIQYEATINQQDGDGVVILYWTPIVRGIYQLIIDNHYTKYYYFILAKRPNMQQSKLVSQNYIVDENNQILFELDLKDEYQNQITQIDIYLFDNFLNLDKQFENDLFFINMNYAQFTQNGIYNVSFNIQQWDEEKETFSPLKQKAYLKLLLNKEKFCDVQIDKFQD